MVAEGRSELLVVKLSDQWVSDEVRLGNELDLDAEVERVPCHQAQFNGAFVGFLMFVKHFKVDVCYSTQGQKPDDMLSTSSLVSQPRRQSPSSDFDDRD